MTTLDENIPAGAARIPLLARDGTARAYVLLDEADAAWANQWTWRRHGGGRYVFAGRTVSVDGVPQTINMVREMLQLAEDDPRGVQHLNRDGLDCRRSNLALSGRGGGGDRPTAEAIAAARADLDQAPRGYHAVKAAAAVRGVRVEDLLALAPRTDPFYHGMPTQREHAEWLKALWDRFQFPPGVHERRIHYHLVSTPNLKLPDGTDYENTETSEEVLQRATKAARYLGLVPVEDFEDRRNPPPYINVEPRLVPAEPAVEVRQPYRWELPHITTDLLTRLELPRPVVEVTGYDYAEADQPYLLEVWIEKSTMNDVLKDLCAAMGVNFVTGVGFQSITNSVKLVRERIIPHNKPARIFYISDFDPAGDGMPVAAARHLEWWIGQYAPDADVKLTPLALTAEQVKAYHIPRSPIKKGENRGPAFEERYGKDAAELDALETLHPGVLAQIVTEALVPYRDDDLRSHLGLTHLEAQGVAEDAWQADWAEDAEELENIETEAKAILASYEERLQALEDELQAELAPLQERLTELEDAVDERAEEFETELPDRPEPVVDPPDESDWLLDVQRPYFTQLAVYKARKRQKSGNNGAGDSDDEDDAD